MSRFTGPRLKKMRGLGTDLPGLSRKSTANRPYPPGQHGRDKQVRRGRASDYLVQLREKQKARRIYGVLERQFSRYFKHATKQSGLT